MPYDPREDHYATIGVADDATPAEIKRAYREKAKLVHPDGHRNPGLATRATQQLNAAYAVLNDPEKRREYDEQRAAHRLRENEPEIQRRVAQVLAQMNSRPAARQSRSRNGSRNVARERADERLRKSRETVEERLRQVRAQAKTRTPLGLVPKTQLGAFSRLAEPKVSSLLRKNQTFDAVLLGVGAAMLDAWLGTTPRRG